MCQRPRNGNGKHDAPSRDAWLTTRTALRTELGQLRQTIERMASALAWEEELRARLDAPAKPCAECGGVGEHIIDTADPCSGAHDNSVVECPRCLGTGKAG